jgi:hypothetical protein
MKFLILIVTIILVAALPAFSQDDYTRTITSRAEKIVSTLNITDPDKKARLVQTIASQYRNLNTIHTRRDEQIKSLKASTENQEALTVKIQTVETEANIQLEKLHTSYLEQLSKELSPSQVDQVKDGMTYGVLPITYKGYQDMIPTLTAAQKEQILQWLTEAREHAMDAESSEKKHWWFGKYKGRINNYLSAAGYDLKKEGEAWEKRRQDAKKTN